MKYTSLTILASICSLTIGPNQLTEWHLILALGGTYERPFDQIDPASHPAAWPSSLTVLSVHHDHGEEVEVEERLEELEVGGHAAAELTSESL